jgi:hypothetical protein
MNRHHQRTLEAIYAHPLRHGLRASQVEALCRSLGAQVEDIGERRLRIRMPSGQETWIRRGEGVHHPDLDPEAILRLPMPVRSRIQSSLVSTRLLSKALLTTLCGRQLPHATNSMPRGGRSWGRLVNSVALSTTEDQPIVGSVNHR